MHSVQTPVRGVLVGKAILSIKFWIGYAAAGLQVICRRD